MADTPDKNAAHIPLTACLSDTMFSITPISNAVFFEPAISPYALSLLPLLAYNDQPAIRSLPKSPTIRTAPESYRERFGRLFGPGTP